ncbi:MAG: YeeE/YedE family protein [Gammaproteobacteria bacterium]|nr:YeeE/YedE family protein [Gammaproteobacteria bacterium]NIR85439.1 YeeE/YedE family protein [Gammaproteobacteria bacterium]NIR89430.1 YeeE/YedE family protein [Gammaproteobacteria bacterium]NIU06575.1 YeeE/YedE family protein [Gammaproteobacteria bacterium]NIV53458.1 YeeE/YedE family protein [Gammaproteobacteria bacterium]
MSQALLWCSVPLAALVGFAAHRASVCTVRAVAEMLSNRRAWMLASFAKTVLWVMALAVPLAWWSGRGLGDSALFPLTAAALLGGFVFGVGAALNGGCAFSTLAHLADGHVVMLGTLGGFCVGAALWLLQGGPPTPAATYFHEPRPWHAALVLGIWLWAAYELRRLWRSRTSERPSWRMLGATRYRLSTAAACMGLCGGLLYTLNGSWTHTTTLERGVGWALGKDVPPGVWLLGLFAALFAGMLFSGWQRKALRVRAAPWRAWLRHTLAGVLMGAGAAGIPGGNDALILHAAPAWSPHAVPAYATLLAGVAFGLIMMRRVTGMSLVVRCRGDVCESEAVEEARRD